MRSIQARCQRCGRMYVSRYKNQDIKCPCTDKKIVVINDKKELDKAFEKLDELLKGKK